MKKNKEVRKIDHEIRTATLRTLQLFEDLGQEQLMEVSKITTISNWKKNEAIFRQGDLPRNFCFVNKGLVKIIRVLKPGQEMILRIVTEGECFGIFAIFAEQAYHASAICEGEVTLAEIPIDPFFDFLDKHPAVYRFFLRLISMKSNQMVCKLPEMALTRVESRIAKILLNLTTKIGYIKNKQYQVDMPLTRKEIAAMAGTTTETVVRILGKMEKTSMIKIDKHHITLLNLEYLESLVDTRDHIVNHK